MLSAINDMMIADGFGSQFRMDLGGLFEQLNSCTDMVCLKRVHLPDSIYKVNLCWSSRLRFAGYVDMHGLC